MDKIRLIVSDMDGTLLNEKQELSSDTSTTTRNRCCTSKW